MIQLSPHTPTLRMSAIALATTALMACASNPPTSEEQAAVTETTPAMAPDQGSPPVAEPQRGKMTELRQQLETLNVTVNDTPEGQLKISIPSDTSFGLGRTTVGPAFARLLNGVADVLNSHPNTAIEIVGHTDTTGTDALNLALSKKRAENTKAYLVGRSVADDRISTEGQGSDQPIGDNSTVQGRAMNRRVELFVSER